MPVTINIEQKMIKAKSFISNILKMIPESRLQKYLTDPNLIEAFDRHVFECSKHYDFQSCK